MGGPRIFLTVTFLDLLRTLDGEVEERVLLCHLRYPMDPERLDESVLKAIFVSSIACLLLGRGSASPIASSCRSAAVPFL